MSLIHALAALTTQDQPAIEQLTRETIRLYPVQEWWPYVAEALWLSSHTLDSARTVRNAAAYIRTVAMRIRRQAEDSLMGPQPVLDGHRRVIGTVHLTAYVSDEGEVSSVVQEAVSVPSAGQGTDMERRRRARAGTAVETETDEEARLQALYLQGYSRRDAADILGWTILEVETVWARLYRRRCKGNRHAPLRTM